MMSEKITFRELIDSIADKTDNSKKFTHDFLKDFADIINNGLEEDGKVNIAGFGKFGLHRLNERKGYNPQTGESMTIPAHNKIIFKPYKELRELVNAPYAEMEPEIIDDENITGQSGEKNKQDQQKFTPTAPPPSVDDEASEDINSLDQKEEDFYNKQTAETTSSKFSLDEKEEESSTDRDDSYDNDIVEFKHGQKTFDEDLEAFISGETLGGERDDYTPTANDEVFSEEEPAPMEDDPAAFSSAEKNKTGSTKADELPEPVPQPEFPVKTDRNRKKNSNAFILAAAVIVLLLVAGSGYVLLQSQQATKDGPDQASSSASTAIIDQNQEIDADQQAQQQDEEQQPVQSQQPERQESQQSAEKKSVDIEINQGQTLWGMAESQYDNPYLWPWIYDANKSSIDDPDLIIAGQTLTVPIPSGAQNSLTSSDSVEVAIGYVETYKWYKDKGVDNAKLYLRVAANYNEEILNRTEFEIDKDDLAFANRSQV